MNIGLGGLGGLPCEIILPAKLKSSILFHRAGAEAKVEVGVEILPACRVFLHNKGNILLY